MRQFLVQLLLFCSFVLSASAQEAKPLAADPEIEKRMQTLAKEFRCLVCQNETIADSQADLAQDLRAQIREQIRAGKSDKEIITYMPDRYGQFVLYRPPVTPTTYLLWFGPFVFLLAGLAVLFRYVKQRRELIPEPQLSEEQRRRVEAILKEGEKTA